MLLEFKVKNFKSFRDECAFSMIPAQKIKDLDYSVLKTKIGGKGYKALSTAVIYGPNASGKTNIIGAMEVLKQIIMNGNIRNNDNTKSPNLASKKLELIPNTKNEKSEPIDFTIKFIEKNIIFEYHLSLNIGKFMDIKYARNINREMLIINEKVIYDRTDKVEIGDIDSIKQYRVKGFDEVVSKKYAENNLNSTEIFLTRMFKTLYSEDLANTIYNWFDKKFEIIYSFNAMSITPNIPDQEEEKLYTDEILDRAAKHFGLGGAGIAFIIPKEGTKPEMFSMVIKKDNNFGTAVPSDVFESYGTVRFLNIFPIVLEALSVGETLVIDEFDASLHPMALMSIISAFHNDEINIHGAQLIFNTHNPIFLNRNVFRRDEIKFVEKNGETDGSNHYSLSDFGTTGENGVRNTDDYMKNYFINQYGAIKNIDFSDIIIEAINSSNEGGV